ncbi:fimbria/pilus outer membrane usher protein [Serratia marcescens]|uniref:Fimbria/pilus outer membrane usher protein n=1 Tax=Serratia marcescens TaxID=615 RepID=A0A939SR70_SERMA|nr:fimbria/pilus outer membrane usher protein [Serratia marcescens]
MRSGFNYDARRFRNYSTYSNQSSTKWKGINTYAEQLWDSKNTLTIGDSSTSGDVFDSFQFRGLKLASDPSMWPDSQRGFAPTVRGIAQSNAEVTIKQNGYIIYQTHVPAGSFEITILPHHLQRWAACDHQRSRWLRKEFLPAFSSVPIMLRENMIRNEFTMGNIALRSANQKYKFLQASTIYGLKDDKTLYGGAIISEKHQGISAGIGSNWAFRLRLCRCHSHQKPISHRARS